MRELLQSRLDVANKSRSNIFNWRGQFTPQFVDYLLEEFASDASAVADPFCGSGTVLLEAAARDLNAFGVEINPAAYAMAKFSTLSALSQSDRVNLSKDVEAMIADTSRDFGDRSLWEDSPNFRAKAKNLLDFGRALLDRSETKKQTLLAALTLFQAESVRNGDLNAAVRKGYSKLREQLIGLPRVSVTPRVHLCDARMTSKVITEECDFLLTSPPYINVFNYHQNHRAIVELLGFDVLSVARSEIGSNRKNRANRFKTVVQYALEMEQCLLSFNHILRDGGYAVMVLGRESNVRGIPFKNGEMVKAIAQDGGIFNTESSHERSFTNRFGVNIVEDILVFRKSSTATNCNVARTIAGEALEQGLKAAEGDVADDVAAALQDLQDVQESPRLDRLPIF